MNISQWAESFWVWLQSESNWLAFRSLQAIVTIAAVIIGGFWTYQLFVRRRQAYPRVDVAHRIYHCRLPDGKVLLRVVLEVHNKGEILLVLDSGFTRLSQVQPCESELYEGDKQREIDWPVMSEKSIYTSDSAEELGRRDGKAETREVEPGETDEIPFDFIVGADVQIVLVYSYLKNARKRWKRVGLCPKRREIGWNVSTLYDFPDSRLLAQAGLHSRAPDDALEGGSCAEEARTAQAGGEAGSPKA